MATPSASLELFAACAPGLEPLLADEVAALAPTSSGDSADAHGLDVRELVGGVAFRGDVELLYRANLELGLALKVLVRLARFRAHDFARLEREAAAVDWAAWVPEGASVKVRATCSKSKLYHSGAVAERVQRAIAGAVRIREPAASTTTTTTTDGDRANDESESAGADAPAPLEIHARLVRDECVLSLDSSGTSLHKRGYRLETGKAPLREDLARALLLLSGWDRQSPVVDPFCGSGTLAIEAGLLARNTPPGAGRAFAFFASPTFDADRWNRVRRAAAGRQRDGEVELWASDRDAGAVEATRRNAERAGVAVRADESPLSSAPAWQAVADRGFLVATNPPYGARVARGRDLLPLYQSLARLVGERPASRLALVAADDRLVSRARLPVERAVTTSHGGKKVGLYRPRPGRKR